MWKDAVRVQPFEALLNQAESRAEPRRSLKFCDKFIKIRDKVKTQVRNYERGAAEREW